MSDATVGVDRLDAALENADTVLHMDEEAFRVLYEETARPLWAYLSRLTGSTQAADDLLQETFYRFLRAPRACHDDAHRRNYLFRIATNLARDHHRRRVPAVVVLDDAETGALGSDGEGERLANRADLSRAFERLKPRERALLWLAYALGSSHQEIGQSLGVKTASVKLLLFRARRRLAALLNPQAAERRDS